MKRAKILSAITLILFAALFSVSCKSTIKPDEEMHPLIIAHSKGQVSVITPIAVRFTDDTEFLTVPEPGGEIDTKIFSLSPAVKGRATWIDGNTIAFMPETQLDNDRDYNVTVNVSKLAETKDYSRTFTFVISTGKNTFSYFTQGLAVYNDLMPNIYSLKGTINTSDFTQPKDAEKILSVSPGKYEVAWNHNSSGTSHEFVIDSIRARESSFDISLVFNGAPIGQDASSEELITVPEAGMFKLLDVNVEYSPEFVVIATFSAPLGEKQRMSNYISISDGTNLRFVVILNKVYIYPPSRKIGTYELDFASGIRSRGGETLKEDESRTVVFDDIEPSVKFLSNGTILPSDNNMTIPFRAVNFAEVEVKVSQIFENNILQFFQENSMKGDNELYRVSREITRTTLSLGERDSDKLRNWNTYSLDLSKLISPQPGAIYRVMLRGKDALVTDYDEGYYSDYYFGNWSTYKDRARNILASDLGIISKMNDANEMEVFVTNLITAMPEPGVDVKVYDLTNQLIREGITDNNGQVSLGAGRYSPHTVIASNGSNRGYMRVNSGYNLSLSSFDVSGEASKKGIKGFIYGERGVWRPGDNIYLTFILQDKDDILPKNHPVMLEFVNPMGQIVTTQTKVQGENGIYAFELKTDEDAPTGNWTAMISLGGETFKKTIKVETIKPNRLKIDFKLNDSPFLKSNDVRGRMSSNWLTGAKAPKLETRIEMSLSSMTSSFKGYDGYVFDDRTKVFYTEEQELFGGNTDESGDLSFSKKVDGLENAPGQLRARFTVRLYEPGGEFSIDQYSTVMTPYKTFVGISAPQQNSRRRYARIDTEKDQKFNVVALSDEGKPAGRKNLHVEIYRIEWSWWWNSYDSSLARYTQSSYHTPVFSTDIQTADGKCSFTYRWDREEWGLYLLRVNDPEGGHSSSVVYYVDWPGYYRSTEGDGTGAAMLAFKSDKDKYVVGDKAQVTIPSSKGSRALVTIETSSKVMDYFWVNCEEGQTAFEIPVTEEMTPNVYVYVTLIQPYSQTENDAPMRLYGVIPMFVENPRTILYPIVNVPQVIAPESEFTVKVNERNGEPMSYTLAIVDDGLLDLTRFRTPDPWSSFFAREALGIRTWDLYDLVIGAYGGKIERMFAIGGDDEMDGSSNTKAQRFKPVVKFMGPFTIGKGATGEHKIALPPYVGSVRTMVVAANGKAFGSAEKTSQVRKPVMITTTLPRVIGTGEEFLLPVTVFAMEEEVRNVKVSLEKHEMFEVVGSATQNVAFSETGDKTVYFKLRSKEKEGIGRISVLATTKGDSAAESLEIDVRNPNPRITVSSMEIVESGKTYNGKFKLAGIKGTNDATLEVSSVPPLNLSSRLKYLLSYPHGCIEQTTSAAFPQIYLKGVANTDKNTDARSEKNVKAALSRLTRFQTAEGGFAYWPGERRASVWGTTYAGHFMIEAERMGYSLPVGMKDKWVNYEKSRAKNWSPGNDYSTDQAYRLYVLALAKQAERSAMNRMLEQKDLSAKDKWFLAGAYALDGRVDIARTIISGLPRETGKQDPFSYDFGSDERDKAVMISVLTTLGNKREAFTLVSQLSEVLSSNKWLSTQSTAWALMSISMYVEQTKENSQMSFEYNIAGAKGSDKTIKAISEIPLDVAEKDGEVSVKFTNKGDNTLYMKLTSSGIAPKGEETAAANNLKIAVSYVDNNGKALNVKELKQGTDFEAVVTITNPGTLGNYTNMILSTIFASGWEIRNNRLNFDETGNDAVRYQDIRDDRVYSYFDIRANNSLTVKIQLTATFCGRFYLPPVVCEAMYDNSINASSSGMWCEVVE